MEKYPVLFDTSGKVVYDGRDITVFEVWLRSNTYISHHTDFIKENVFKVLRFSDSVHGQQERKDGSKYMNHIVRVILDGDHAMKDTSLLFFPRKIIIRAVHDVIEDHPHEWKNLYHLIGVHLFRDALVLSTGGVSLAKRTEMIHFFEMLDVSDDEMLIYDEINQILNPLDPLSKLTLSRYSKKEKQQDRERMFYAISLYRDAIIRKESHGNNEKDDDMYIVLGNYIYFTQENARDKVADMYDNMGDMAAREKEKPGYTEKRRIKAYILGVKLREHHMYDEYRRLEKAFQDVGSSMLSDKDVHNVFHTIKSSVSLPWEG